MILSINLFSSPFTKCVKSDSWYDIPKRKAQKKSLLQSWLTSDEKIEEQAPWVRMNIASSLFRPPTLFNFDTPEEHDLFDNETVAIKRELTRAQKMKKRKDAAPQKKILGDRR